MREGMVFVLPGIEGQSRLNRNIATGLDRGGVKAAIEIFDWTSGIPGNFVGNLVNYRRNREKARLLASRIVAYREKRPSAPVILVGHSGGCGIAALAIEALPAGRQIDLVIMIAPAISPNYDLTTVLRRTRLGVVNCYSAFDSALLGAGTTVFGTIDRGRGAAAGMVGFDIPEDLGDRAVALYEAKLRQVQWTDKLTRFGAMGDHFTWASVKFAETYLAQLVLRDEPPAPETMVAASRPAKRRANGVEATSP
jgi:pimeloyl-ACP methyl ester carboxylesterase